MGPPQNKFIISSVRVYRGGGPHAQLAIWNRGGKCGELIVNAKDAGEIAERLFGDLPTVVSLKNNDRNYDLWEVDADLAKRSGLV